MKEEHYTFTHYHPGGSVGPETVITVTSGAGTIEDTITVFRQFLAAIGFAEKTINDRLGEP